MEIPAEVFGQRTFFISEDDETELLNDDVDSESTKEAEVFVNAKGTMSVNGNTEPFVALAIMLESDIPYLKELIKMGENDEPVIETDDIISHDEISGCVVNNYHSEEYAIENVDPEVWKKLRQNEKVKAEFSLDQDEENTYINGFNISRPERQTMESATSELVEHEVKAPKA